VLELSPLSCTRESLRATLQRLMDVIPCPLTRKHLKQELDGVYKEHMTASFEASKATDLEGTSMTH